MPLYEYRCQACGHKQSHILKVDDRKIPETKPCPECGFDDVLIELSTPAIVGGVATNFKTDSGFKDLLGEMKKNVPNNRITID